MVIPLCSRSPVHLSVLPHFVLFGTRSSPLPSSPSLPRSKLISPSPLDDRGPAKSTCVGVRIFLRLPQILQALNRTRDGVM